jgi:hypothetical protein
VTEASWLRRAGAGETRAGQHVTWSVAEGRRGRRWREVVAAAGGRSIQSSLLLELDPDGRFSHLELSTATGLLTLHPEGDGTLHGNAVTERGIEHVAGRPWRRDAVVLVEGSAVCLAVAPPAGTNVGALHVSLALELSFGAVAIEPSGIADGLPELINGRSWPLEATD